MNTLSILIVLLCTGCATTTKICDRGDFLVKSGYDHVYYCGGDDWVYLGCNKCKIGDKDER